MATNQHTHYTNLTWEFIWENDRNHSTSSGDDPDVFINLRIKERSVAPARNYGGQLVVTESVSGPVEKVYRIEFGDMIFYRKLTDCVKDILSKEHLLYNTTNNTPSCDCLWKELVDYSHNAALTCITTRLKSNISRLDIIADVEVEKITISDNVTVEEVFARVQSESMEDNQQKVRFAASNASINMLERRKYEMETCTICKDDFLIGEEIIVMPCNQSHIFHEKCIVKWLEESHLCPLCRFKLPTED